MNKPLVSILIPAYNAAKFLNEICVSVQSQTFNNFEALIWDDGSTDNTDQVLEKFAKDSRFQIFHSKQNRGLNRAWWELLRLAKGDFWCSPGADDVLFPDFLESRLTALSENSNAVMIHGAPQIIDEHGKVITEFPFVKDLPREMKGERALRVLMQHNIINQPSALVRTAVTKPLLPLFGTDWKYAPDWYLWILHLSSGLDLLWEPEPKHQYRVHSQSLSLGTSYNTVRRAEVRLVPLCALSAASGSSQLAAAIWREWAGALYDLWLRRAFTLRKSNGLPQWLETGAKAFYGKTKHEPSLFIEIGKHAVGMILNSRAEEKSLANQKFRVSGLAQINDAVFR